MTMQTILAALREHLPNLLAAVPVALLVLIAGLLCQLALSRALTLLARKCNMSDSDMLPLRKFARGLVYGVTFIAILGVFGFELGGLWAMLSTVLAMVAIGFVAVWSMLSNTTATLLLLIQRPFQIGDTIELQSENMKGRVTDIGFFYTTLVAEDDSTFRVPNNLFFQKVIKRHRPASPASARPTAGADSNEVAATQTSSVILR